MSCRPMSRSGCELTLAVHAVVRSAITDSVYTRQRIDTSTRRLMVHSRFSGQVDSDRVGIQQGQRCGCPRGVQPFVNEQHCDASV